MLKIYGLDASPRALKVKMCANALGLDYEYITVDLAEGDNKTADYLAVHPAGKIPAIDDAGFTLFESNAICKYLCRNSGSSLYPEAILKQAVVDQWCDFTLVHVDAHFASLLFNKVFAPKFGMEVDQQALRERPAFIDRFLSVIDGQLSKTRYLADNEMTVADICLLASIEPAEVVEVDIKRYPKLDVWRENLRSQAFYQTVHKHYGESLGMGV